MRNASPRTMGSWRCGSPQEVHKENGTKNWFHDLMLHALETATGPLGESFGLIFIVLYHH